MGPGGRGGAKGALPVAWWPAGQGAGGEPARLVGHGGAVNSLAIRRQGDLLATASEDHTACVCGNADRDGLQRRSGPPVGAGIPAPRGLCGATAKLCSPSPLPPMAVASSPGLRMEPLASGRRGGGP